MTNLREAAQMALDALIGARGYIYHNVLDDKSNKYDTAIEALRAALAQPEPKYEWTELSEKDAAELKEVIEKEGRKPAQPEQEPVAWGFQNTGITGSNRWMYLRETIPTDDQYRGVFWMPLYTAPPQRKWVGLKTEDLANETDIANSSNKDIFDFRKAFWCGARWAEAKLKEKNA